MRKIVYPGTLSTVEERNEHDASFVSFSCLAEKKFWLQGYMHVFGGALSETKAESDPKSVPEN